MMKRHNIAEVVAGSEYPYITSCGSKERTDMFLTTKSERVSCRQCLEVMAVATLAEMKDKPFTLTKLDRAKDDYGNYEHKGEWDIADREGRCVGRIRLPHGYGKDWEIAVHEFGQKGGHRFATIREDRGGRYLKEVTFKCKSEGLVWANEHPEKFKTLEAVKADHAEWIKKRDARNARRAEEEKREAAEHADALEGLHEIAAQQEATLSNFQMAAVQYAIKRLEGDQS